MEKNHVVIYKGTSKKGNKFSALKIQVGKFSALQFASDIEMEYLENRLPVEFDDSRSDEKVKKDFETTPVVDPDTSDFLNG